jgi:hypothetical protein
VKYLDSREMKQETTDENKARGGPYLQNLEDQGGIFFESSGSEYPVT